MFWLIAFVVGATLLASLFTDPLERKPKRDKPIPPKKFVPSGMPGPQPRFVHRDGYHNRYWTTGNKSQLRPWIRNIR